MAPQRSPRQLGAALALGGLLFAAALLLPDDWSDGGGGGDETLVPDFPPFFDGLLVALCVAIFVSAAVVLVALTLRRDPSAPVRRKGPAGALVLLVLAALAAAVFANSRPPEEVRRAPDDAGSSQELPAAEGGSGTDGSKALGLLLSGVVILLVVGGPIAAWRFARARVPESVREEAFDELLLQEVDEGIADLATIGDPRAAVIACYGRLQRLARWGGIEVRASDTSSELLDALAQRSPALEPSAARLIALFQTARFSVHPMDEADRAEAMAALSEVRDRLVVTA